MRAPPLSVAARGGPAHVLGNIWASVECQTNPPSPIGQAAKEVWHLPQLLRKVNMVKMAFVFYPFLMEHFA